MKKIVKLLTALGMISLLFSFVACDIPTESELLGGDNKNINNDDPVISSPGGGSSTLWSSFDGADMQVWENTATLTETDEGLDIEIGNAGWWGMCFCNAAGVGAGSDAVTFDMSKVAKVTIDVKANQNASMWVSCFDQSANTPNPKKIDIGTSYETKEVALSGNGNRDYGVLAIGGNNETGTTVKTGVVISIKNIKLFTSTGEEISPARND